MIEKHGKEVKTSSNSASVEPFRTKAARLLWDILGVIGMFTVALIASFAYDESHQTTADRADEFHEMVLMTDDAVWEYLIKASMTSSIPPSAWNETTRRALAEYDCGRFQESRTFGAFPWRREGPGVDDRRMTELWFQECEEKLFRHMRPVNFNSYLLARLLDWEPFSEQVLRGSLQWSLLKHNPNWSFDDLVVDACEKHPLECPYFLPDQYITQERVRNSLELQHAMKMKGEDPPRVLRFPDSLWDQELADLAFLVSSKYFDLIPIRFRTKEMIEVWAQEALEATEDSRAYIEEQLVKSGYRLKITIESGTNAGK